LPLIGTMLRELGHDVRIYVESLGAVDWERVIGSDVVGVSTITSTAMRAYRYAERVRNAGIPVVIGGPHVTFMPDEALQAEAMGADYLGLSPIFVTATKPELMNQIGLEGIGPIRRATRLPLIGIGSMNETNACSVIRAGLDGVAVVSAICCKPDACAAAEKIMQEILRARGRV